MFEMSLIHLWSCKAVGNKLSVIKFKCPPLKQCKQQKHKANNDYPEGFLSLLPIRKATEQSEENARRTIYI